MQSSSPAGGVTMSNQLASGEEVESALLCELVDGLTATRTERAVVAMIDAWTNRVHTAGLDPGALLDTFKGAASAVHPTRDASRRWANASTRELVLVCVELYERERSFRRTLPHHQDHQPVCNP